MSHADWRLTSALTALYAGASRLREEDPDAEIELGDLDAAEDVESAARALIRAIQQADDMAGMAKKRADELTTRVKRFQDRSARYRGLLLSTFDAMGWKKREWPEATVTLRAGNPGVVVTDEAAIPEEYVRVTRSPDKPAIGADLKAGVVIPGAALANGMPSLQIRGA